MVVQEVFSVEDFCKYEYEISLQRKLRLIISQSQRFVGILKLADFG